MNKNESKYFNTALLMDEALIYLLEKKDIEFITVKEICEKAGVNRSTFYLHYESVDDLLEETMQYIIRKFVKYFDGNTNEFINKIKDLPLESLNLIQEKYLIPYLNFIKENKKIFKASFSNPKGMQCFEKYSSLEKYIFVPILDRFKIPDSEKKYCISFYFKGISAIIEEWVKGDCQDSIEDMNKIIIKCVTKNNIMK